MTGLYGKNTEGPLRRILPWIAAFAIATSCVTISRAQAPKECGQIDGPTTSRILHMAAKMLRTEPEFPSIDDQKLVPGTCYWQLFLSVPNSDHHWTFYLSPDKRFLSGSLWDLSADPEAADAQVALRLQQQMQENHSPTRGSESAPLDVVVFSDFQCPFCSRFADIVGKYQRENPAAIRLVFRNSPLSTHEWAVPAAQAGICVSRQNAAAFWKFHDFLFERQNTVTKDNLDSVVREFLVGAEGISADEYLQCAASSYPKLQLERELADSRALNIHATPTVFINGKRFGGFRDEDAFAKELESARHGNGAKKAVAQ